jgi:hypothetical protein
MRKPEGEIMNINGSRPYIAPGPTPTQAAMLVAWADIPENAVITAPLLFAQQLAAGGVCDLNAAAITEKLSLPGVVQITLP